MKQSVPWSVKGVEADARETAKELARRSGMTLGQWLNAMIAEQTGENADVEAPLEDIAGSPLETLANRLETMNRRASATAPIRDHADAATDRLRETEARTAELLEALFRRSAEAEARTVGMIEGLARANKAIETKTANALSAVAKWIETAERAPKVADLTKAAERQTTEAVKSIAARLDQIESKLPQEAATKPIKAAIESLEARLGAFIDQGKAQRVAPDELSRTAAELERRLSAMADQLEAGGKESSPARAAAAEPAGEIFARAEPARAAAAKALVEKTRGGGDLLEAVDQIASRQRLLDDLGSGPNVPAWPPKPRGLADVGQGSSRRAQNEIEVQIANLTREVAAMRQAQAGATAGFADDPTMLQLRDDVASMARMVGKIASQPATPAFDASIIEARIDDLGSRIDGLRQSGASETAIRSVENHVAEMIRAIGNGTHRELSTIATELRSITAKLDQIGEQKVASAAAEFDGALRGLRADMAALSKSVSAGPTKAMEGLERRIEEIGERILDLRDAGAGDRLVGQVEARLAELSGKFAELVPQNGAALADELRAIEAKLDLVTAQGIDPAAITRLHHQTEAIHALVAQSRQPGSLEALTQRIEALSGQVEGMGTTLGRTQAGPSNASLEAMILQLVERLETAQRPEADDRSFAALERQIARIAEKLDESGSTAPALSSIERTLSDLFGQLERTREDALGAADGAAMRAVNEAMRQFSGPAQGANVAEDVERHLEDFRSSQDQSDRRTQHTLDAVQVTLERLAGRMDQLENDVEGQRLPADSFGALTSSSFAAPAGSEVEAIAPAAQAAAPAPVQSPRSDPRRAPQPAAPPPPERHEAKPAMPRAATLPAQAHDLGGDIPLEPGLGSPRASFGRVPTEGAKAMFAAAGSSDQRASFIAAARRAVLAAANETGQASDARAVEGKFAAAGEGRIEPSIDFEPHQDDIVAESAEKTPARSPIERMRVLYSRRKRPILLGIAAIVVALGTIQIAKLALPSPDDLAMPATAPAVAPPAEPAPEAARAPPPATAATPPAAALPADPAMAPPPGSIDAPKPQSELLAPATQAPAIQPAPSATAAAAPPPASTGSIGEGVPSLGVGLANTPLPAAILAPEAPKKLQDAVKTGDPRALYDMASRLADSRNPERDLSAAAALYEKASDKGFAPAQYRLGSMYEKGVGVEKDVAKARLLYERAADKGNIKSMHNMAVLFAEGAIGGKADYASAAQWFRLAAEHGLRDSEYNYAILVARGLGSAVDLAEAYKWLALAAAQGDQDAASKRDEIGAKLDADSLGKAKAATAAFVARNAPPIANDATLPAVSWSESTQGGA